MNDAVQRDNEHWLLDGERDRDLGRGAGDRSRVHEHGVGVGAGREARRTQREGEGCVLRLPRCRRREAQPRAAQHLRGRPSKARRASVRDAQDGCHRAAGGESSIVHAPWCHRKHRPGGHHLERRVGRELGPGPHPARLIHDAGPPPIPRAGLKVWHRDAERHTQRSVGDDAAGIGGCAGERRRDRSHLDLNPQRVTDVVVVPRGRKHDRGVVDRVVRRYCGTTGRPLGERGNRRGRHGMRQRHRVRELRAVERRRFDTVLAGCRQRELRETRVPAQARTIVVRGDHRPARVQ